MKPVFLLVAVFAFSAMNNSETTAQLIDCGGCQPSCIQAPSCCPQPTTCCNPSIQNCCPAPKRNCCATRVGIRQRIAARGLLHRLRSRCCGQQCCPNESRNLIAYNACLATCNLCNSAKKPNCQNWCFCVWHPNGAHTNCGLKPICIIPIP